MSDQPEKPDPKTEADRKAAEARAQNQTQAQGRQEPSKPDTAPAK